MSDGVRTALLLGVRGGGGEEVFLRELAATPPRGWSFDPILDDHASRPGAQSRRLRAALFNRLVHPFLWPLQGVRSWRVDARFDLVHVHNVATLLDVPHGTPVVFSAGGGGYPHYLRRYLGWTPDRVRARYARARTLHRRFGVRSEVGIDGGIDAFVVFSPLARDELAAIDVDPERIHVIPPGFNLPVPSPRERDASRPFTALLFGRDPHRKGADLAISAVRRLRNEGVDVRLRLIGDPTYPDRSGDGVEGVRRIERSTLLADEVARADVVLVPSRAEGFGFAAVEAMGYGVPVITSNESALPWIVGAGGVVVPRDDADALSAALRGLVDDPARRTTLGEAGRTRFFAEFAPDVSRRRLGALYDDLLNRSQG